MREGAAAEAWMRPSWSSVEYDEGTSGQRFKAHPATEQVGTVWGFGDFSGEIQTH